MMAGLRRAGSILAWVLAGCLFRVVTGIGLPFVLQQGPQVPPPSPPFAEQVLACLVALAAELEEDIFVATVRSK